MLLTYVDHSDGKQDYRPVYAREDAPWLVWTIPGSNWTFLYWRQGCFFGQNQTSFAFIPINSLKCLYEVVLARFLACLACDIASIHENPLYPSSLTIQTLFAAGDQLLANNGNRAYNTIRKLEGLVIGAVIKFHDPGLLTDPESYYSNLTADIQEVGTQDEKDFCQIVHDLVGKSPNHHHSFQMFGLFRMWGYPHVDIHGV
ncbi:unnamed protein product [Heligmosomoides polygyrus]|uniref:RdRp catalytic domain-containing protein n=1 Tax=Heligmosomoides polygyrus TaxID=6339 RepID=A0A183GIK6_HELPZ|nr:unnamed protein product [Heligmosomoides polygyrus]